MKTILVIIGIVIGGFYVVAEKDFAESKVINMCNELDKNGNCDAFASYVMMDLGINYIFVGKDGLKEMVWKTINNNYYMKSCELDKSNFWLNFS